MAQALRMASSSMSPEPRAQSLAAQQAHTRVYQACIPCRTRKVKCDLGPVDNPHDPPCGRCRREQKHCYFSSTRRKRKTADGEEQDDAEASDYERRNARKKARADSTEKDVMMPRRQALPVNPGQSQTSAPRPLTPGGSEGRPIPLRRPTQQGHTDEETNDTTGLLQREEIFSGHDALLTLSKAAEMNMRSNLAASYASSTPGSHTMYPSPGSNGLPLRDGVAHNMNGGETVVDPSIYANGEVHDAAFQDALKAWSRFRFVRAGWITAREAILYMEYFFKYISPLTPIVVSRYQDPSTHLNMLTDDPMLAMTILTIASRFHAPEGPGGQSRGHSIHDTLWKYLQGMIDRMIWGQEQSGGTFSSITQASLGAQPASDINPLARKGLRTLGTVESLMLLTEWHPRALHFPAGNDDDELMAKDEASLWASMQAAAENGGNQRLYDWLEPCWRSDRICWMLLGNAMSLAYEIGVFNEKSVEELQQENPGMAVDALQAYLRRKEHLKDLILIYVTQTSGRVGITSMLPRSQSGETFFKTPDERLADRMRIIRTIASIQQNLPGGLSRDINALPNFDVVIYLWMEIAAIMEAGNQEMFANRHHTRDLIRSGKYSDLLLKFQPLLLGFKRNFESCHTIPEHMRNVLKIEYEYNRVYLNSLALQAVVERCISNTPLQSHALLNGSTNASKRGIRTDGGAIPLQILNKYYGPDRHYISEVSSACREVLKVVVEGLYPGDFLKHAPVRTYFRIISVSIILLKTFALGATAEDILSSIDLLKSASKCMKECIVDDVHIGNRFANLLSDLTDRVRTRLQVMKPNTSGNPSSRAGSPPPFNSTAPSSMMPPPQPVQTWQYQPSPLGPTSPDFNSNGTINGRSSGPPFPDALNMTTTEPYEPSVHSIMPPPYIFNYNEGPNAPGGANGFDFGDYADDGAQLQEWMGLPLDPLFRSYNGADVGQTPYGPDVGGNDFLDVLLQRDGVGS